MESITIAPLHYIKEQMNGIHNYIVPLHYIREQMMESITIVPLHYIREQMNGIHNYSPTPLYQGTDEWNP